MSEYQLTASEEPCAVIRDSDKACIPPDMANRDYAEYLAWVEAGNTPDPYVPPPEPEPGAAETALYDHENRIRVLEGQPPMTREEFQAR